MAFVLILETFWGGLKKSENIPIEPDLGNAGEGRNVSWGFGFGQNPCLPDKYMLLRMLTEEQRALLKHRIVFISYLAV